MDANQLHEILVAVQGNNNITRNAAEKELFRQMDGDSNNFFRCLMEVLLHSDNPGVVNYCSVLCRKYLPQGEPVLIQKLNDDVQHLVKDSLLKACVNQKVRYLRRQIADCISELGQIFLFRNEWPELFDVLQEWTQSNETTLRETAVFVFGRIADGSVDTVEKYVQAFLGIYENAIVDPELSVAIAACNAITLHRVSLDKKHEHIPLFDKFLENMLQVWQKSLQSGDEDSAVIMMRIWVEIASSDSEWIEGCAEAIAVTSAEITQSNEMPESVRMLAMEFFSIFTQSSGILSRRSHVIVTKSAESCFALMATLDEDPDWEREDYEFSLQQHLNADSLFHLGSVSFDRIAESLGKRVFIPVAMETIQNLLCSNGWKEVYVGLWALSQIVEYISYEDLPWQELVHFLKDPRPRVQYAALQLFGHMFESYGPDIQCEAHQDLVPILIEVMKSSCQNVQGHAIATMFNFLSGAPEDSTLDPYARELIDTLVILLTEASLGVQQEALGCLGVVSKACRVIFRDYYPDVMRLLKQAVIQARGTQFVSYRARAMEAITFVGLNMGKTIFMPDAMEVMHIFLDIMHNEKMDSDDVGIQYILHSWTRIAACLRKDVKDCLPAVMPYVMRLLHTNIRVDYSKLDRDFVSHEEYQRNVEDLNNNAEDKMNGINVFAHFLDELEELMVPYVEEAYGLVADCIDYYISDELRSAALSCMYSMLRALGAGCNAGLVDQREFLKYYLTTVDAFRSCAEKEPYTEIRLQIIVCMKNAIEVGASVGQNGGVLLNEDQQKVFGDLLQKLTYKSFKRTQNRVEKQEQGDLDEEAYALLEGEKEEEDELNFAVAEFMGSILKTHKAACLPLFNYMFEHLMHMTDEEMPLNTQCSAWFVFDDMIENLKEQSIPYIEAFGEKLFKSASGQCEWQVQQATGYGVGMMAEHLGDHAKPYLEHMVQSLLMGLEKRDDIDPSCVDNLISSLGRCIRFQRNNLPEDMFKKLITTVLENMPLQHDEDEGPIVNLLICDLIDNNDISGDELVHALHLLAHASYSGFAGEEVQHRICAIFHKVPHEELLSMFANADSLIQENVQKIMNDVRN